MADIFKDHRPGLESPSENFAEVATRDTVDLPKTSRALLLLATGTIKVDALGVGTNIALPLQPGYNVGRFTRVYPTGTDSVTIVNGW